MEEIILDQKFLLDELKRFKKWSGPNLVKILAVIADYGSDPISLGSGGLLEYKNRYFVVTNSHVFNLCSDIVNQVLIPYTVEDKTYKMSVLKAHRDTSKDIAVVEVSFSENILKSNHRFLSFDLVEFNLKEYEKITNVVFCHGYPSHSTSFDYENKEITAESFPYCTFIDENTAFSESDNELILIGDQKGINELGESVSIGAYYGMSGSFAYGYYHQGIIPYKCLGVLTYWYQNEKTLSVTPMDEIVNFIEQHFFKNA